MQVSQKGLGQALTHTPRWSFDGMQLRGRGLWLLVAAVLVSCAFGGAWRFLPAFGDSISNSATSQRPYPKPYYWSIAQLHIAFQNMRTDLLLIDAGARVDPEQLSMHIDALISRVNLLTQPSEMNDSYGGVRGFKEGTVQLAAFSESALQELVRTDFSTESALSALAAFNGIYPVILELSSDAATHDIHARDVALKSIDHQKAVMGGIAALMLLALLGAAILLGRYKRALAARELALQAERLAVQTKMQFLGMVSHELRSPLQSIVSALDVLESTRAVPDRAVLTKRIRRAANELTVQLRDILTLARGQTGRIELRPEVFEACELVRGIAEDLRADATAKGLWLEMTVPEDPIFVVADFVRIGQVLKNLVGNAVRYTERGGVTLTLEPLPDSAAHLRMRIADSGPGLPEQALQMATQNLDAMPLLLGRRRGIGLAVVRALLEQLDGRLRVLATRGGGTTFELTVPAARSEERAPRKGSGEGRLLIVDDRLELVAGFLQACEEAGLNCDTASSAATAMNLLAAHAYGVVLIDLEMPRMNGAELAAHIRASGLNDDAHLVAMSAGRTVGDEDLRVFDVVLPKPVTCDQLAVAIRTRRNRPAPPG